MSVFVCVPRSVYDCLLLYAPLPTFYVTSSLCLVCCSLASPPLTGHKLELKGSSSSAFPSYPNSH